MNIQNLQQNSILHLVFAIIEKTSISSYTTQRFYFIITNQAPQGKLAGYYILYKYDNPPSEDHRDDWFDVMTTTNYRVTIRLNMKSLDLRIASFQLFIEQTNVRKTSTFKNMNSLWPADKIRWYIISCFFNECQLPRVGKSEV